MPKIHRRNCDQCGKYYESSARKFCSRNCAMTYRNIHNNPTKNPDTRRKISNSRKGKPTIMNETHWNWQGGKWKIPNKCPECDSDISYGATYCSKCVNKGERSPHWKGGTTPQRIREYMTEQYKVFIKSVLERDNYICQECGITNGLGKTINLEVHHIKSYAENPELRFDIDNGITLCEECHWDTIRNHKKPKRLDVELRLRSCIKCGKEFLGQGSYKTCPECRILICLFCGKPFHVRNSVYDQTFCSRRCGYDYRKKENPKSSAKIFQTA